MPSVTYETFGLTSIEAFARKTPVIARDLGALPEVVEESGGGIVYSTQDQLLDAVRTIAGSPRLRDDLGRKGYEGVPEILDPGSPPEALLRFAGNIVEETKRRSEKPPCRSSTPDIRPTRGPQTGHLRRSDPSFRIPELPRSSCHTTGQWAAHKDSAASRYSFECAHSGDQDRLRYGPGREKGAQTRTENNCDALIASKQIAGAMGARYRNPVRGWSHEYSLAVQHCIKRAL